MRRRLPALLGCVSVLIVACIAAASPRQAAWADEAVKRPNFIIVVADDMAWDDCGAYGHPRIRTPNLDRLAREGMRFDRAFLTTSSCSPSRASILTGRYPHATGAPELHMPLPPDRRLLTEALRDAGYYTAAAGKWHLGNPAKVKFNLVREGGPPSGADFWLPTLRERPKDQPFFLWLASLDPHRPYRQAPVPRPHATTDVVVPPFLPDTDVVRQDLADYYDEISRFDANVGLVLEELEAQRAARDTFVLVLSDNGRPFPRCKTTLYDDGIRTPFIVRFPGRVKPNTVTRSVVSSIDIAPTVLELAGAKASPTFQGQSFARVLTNPKAKAREYAFAEHNWHDYRAFERGVRSERYTYIRNWLPELPGTPPADAVSSTTFQQMRTLRDQGKLNDAQRSCFIAPRAAEELYDVQHDPHSLHNLASDPKLRPVLERMRKALAAWEQETGDHFERDKLTPDRFDRELGVGLMKPGSK
jgi:arylsulfatase A-like enzyme